MRGLLGYGPAGGVLWTETGASEGDLVDGNDTNIAAILASPTLALSGVVQRGNATGVLLRNWNRRSVTVLANYREQNSSGQMVQPWVAVANRADEVVLTFDVSGTTGAARRFYGLTSADGWVKIADIPR